MIPDALIAREATSDPCRPATRARRVSRRQVLGGALATAGLAALGQGAIGARSTAADFVEPPVLRSKDGRLDVALEARLGPATMGGRTVTTYTYNGQAPGPTLRLRAGETLGITLTNQMAQPTNLHTHGLHVSPTGNSDNVFLHVMPGETFTYEYAIPPDRSSGLYIPGFHWYHPHLHGYTSDQVSGGMAGALIVEGDMDELPGIRDLPERLLFIQATQFDDDGMMIPFPEFDEVAIFVNGQAQPAMAIAPGETQRWRIVNASSLYFFNLGLDGHQLHQIASDANPLREVWSRDQILMAPGERIEVLIQGGPEGTYAFHSLPWGDDLPFQAQPDFPIATLVSAGAAVAPAPLPTTLIPWDDLREATVDRYRELTFSEDLDPFRTLIDGRTFDANRVDQTVELGATEEWRLRNTSFDWHPFHIHVNDFQVISINGQPVDAYSWEDTVPIPALGEIVIRTRFLDFPGKTVYHCHLLDHEDEGMMGVVEIVVGDLRST